MFMMTVEPNMWENCNGVRSTQAVTAPEIVGGEEGHDGLAHDAVRAARPRILRCEHVVMVGG